MIVAEYIAHGAWTARCLNWVVGLQQRHDGWEITLWYWPPGQERSERNTKNGFTGAKKAAKWAADRLSDEGVFVLLNDGDRVWTLVDTLMFTPAPQLAPVLEVCA